MSINSKARRDAKKRQQKHEKPAGPQRPSIEPHAELRDPQGALLGGIVRREGEWTLGLGGRIVGESQSAARVLAILKRAATLHEREGTAVRLTCCCWCPTSSCCWCAWRSTRRCPPRRAG